ncbi:uncharacterized protein LOC142488844 [Ascaphus truei]|uniref:uncharacterized protein LOC142488844 n=1 Tax=Ascaphus truei TaxID=8439 RepID=UPI003F59338C
MPPAFSAIKDVATVVAPEAHVSPHTEQVSSPGSSSSSSRLEEADVANEGQIQSSDHEDVPTRRVTQHSSPPARDTYSAIAASEERILVEENRRHSEIMSVLERMISQQERMISQQERTISQMSQLERVIIQVPKEIQNVNRTLQAIVVNLSQANQLRISAREQQFHFTPSEDGSLHAASFSPESSVLHSPVLDDTGTVGASSVQVPVNIQLLTLATHFIRAWLVPRIREVSLNSGKKKSPEEGENSSEERLWLEKVLLEPLKSADLNHLLEET